MCVHRPHRLTVRSESLEFSEKERIQSGLISVQSTNSIRLEQMILVPYVLLCYTLDER